DLIIIKVVESTGASSTAQTQADRSASSGAGVPRLLGLEKAIPGVKNIVQADSSSTCKGNGSTTRKTELTTSIAGRVTNVLPNGNLVIEGSSNVAINGETQKVVLVGL